MSNMNVIGLMKDMKDEKESPTKFLHPMKSGIKRKETKALTISNPKGTSFLPQRWFLLSRSRREHTVAFVAVGR
jgi:hypothetical protein